MDMEVDDFDGSLNSETLIAKKLKHDEKDVLASDLMVSAAALVSGDSASAVKASTSGSNFSAEQNGSASDLSFQDDAIDDMDDYVDDDDVISDYDDNDEFFYEDDDEYRKLQAQFDNVDLPPGVEASVPWLQDPSPSEKPLAAGISSSSVQDDKSAASSSSKAVSSSLDTKEEQMDDILRKLMYFKQFDTVGDCSDHHYVDLKSGREPSKAWAKKVQEEWKILEQNLPETIFVRVYESRMDLLRAVIVGPSGTPYHDGLFVFDAVFPASYPNEPPMVHYYSSGFRLNPNLYECGKVCLSLLNTWTGGKNEMWLPNKSTMLQVLVSIQALILNAEPFYNEPGYEKTYKGQEGKRKSREYSEDIFIKSVKKMMHTLRNPPQHFEDLVAGHFRVRALDIMTACKAYVDGAEVGCNVKQWLEEGESATKHGSPNFRTEVAKIMKPLNKYFINNGSKDTEKFQN